MTWAEACKAASQVAASIISFNALVLLAALRLARVAVAQCSGSLGKFLSGPLHRRHGELRIRSAWLSVARMRNLRRARHGVASLALSHAMAASPKAPLPSSTTPRTAITPEGSVAARIQSPERFGLGR